MKKLFLLFALLSASASSFAQYKTIIFDYEKNYFNQGQPLPAESYIMVSGQVPTDVEMVEVQVHRTRKVHKTPLYTAVWKRSFSNVGQTFEVPVNYMLRGGNEYDIVLNNYRKATAVEKENLKQTLNASLDAYVDGVISVERRKLSIDKTPGHLVKDLNDIVDRGTSLYLNKINFQFAGFSDIVKNKIQQLKSARLRKGVNVFSKDEYGKRREARRMYSEKLIGELKAAIHTELEQTVNTEMLVLSDNKEVRDYPTEKTRNTLAINVGYGGVYFNGDVNNLSYDHGIYGGLSFPLGRAALSPFWSHTSLSVGAFVNNMRDENDNIVTGPIFGRPFYVGLGYRAFQFIRINAGAAFLETKKDGFNIDLKEIRVQPFIGVSAEVNLWMGLGNKK